MGGSEFKLPYSEIENGIFGNGKIENDKKENDKMENDKMENDKMENDKFENDKFENDKNGSFNFSIFILSEKTTWIISCQARQTGRRVVDRLSGSICSLN